MNKTIEKVKSVGSSLLFLISVITFTAYSVLTILGSTSVAGSVKSQVLSFVGSHETLGQLIDGMGNIFSAMPVGTLVFGIINLLIAIGMWLSFFAFHSRNNPPSTKGMTLIKVMLAIHLVIVVLSVVACVGIVGFAAYAVFVAMSETGHIPTIFFIIGGCIIAAIVIVLAFTMAYYAGIFRTIKSIKMTLHTGVIMGKVSVYVIVMNYIIAAVVLTGAVLSPDITQLIGGICGAVSYVTCSVVLGTLRSEMLYISAKGSSAVE